MFEEESLTLSSSDISEDDSDCSDDEDEDMEYAEVSVPYAFIVTDILWWLSY